MSFAAYCVCQQHDLVVRLFALEMAIQRHRIVREREARRVRLFEAMRAQSPWAH